MSVKNKASSAIALLFTLLPAQALSQNSFPIEIQHNWSQLDASGYLDNRMACEYQIQQFKWSRNLWPSENKNDKPKFSSVADLSTIRQKVQQALRIEQALSDVFNTKISTPMLQDDLNRMAQNTKDSAGLSQLFLSLGNHPRTIAECISKPYLAQKKLKSSFNWNFAIHEETRRNAEEELELYEQSRDYKHLSVKPQHITFQLEKESGLKNQLFNAEDLVVSLNEFEFQQQLSNANFMGLKELENHFEYHELIGHTHDSITVKKFIWKKQSLQDWMKQQPDSPLPMNNLVVSKLTLPSIDTENQGVVGTDGMVEQWLPRKYVPDGRFYHTTIWTGSEMIIWGGINQVNTGDFYHSGGRYDPVIDLWTPTSRVNSPSGRRDHTAIWTGSEMIIWGGYNNSENIMSDGARYDPGSDSWHSIGEINAPEARIYHTAVWDGTTMVVWGGWNGEYLNSGGRYNPNTDQWQNTTTANAPLGRMLHEAIWTGSEMVIWGGKINSNTLVNTGGRYDPVADQWTNVSLLNAPSAREYFSVTWTGSEMIIWGGYATGVFLDSGGRYNPNSNHWETISGVNAPSKRSGTEAVWSGTQMIVWGGYGDDGYLNSGGVYDPNSDSWQATSTTHAPSARGDHSAVWSGSELIIWGGSTLTVTGGRYDPEKDSWQSTDVTNAPSARYHHTTIWTGNEMIVWGGVGNLDSGGRYDPILDRWHPTNTQTAPDGRYSHSAVWSGTEMIVWGGRRHSGSVAPVASLYDPITDDWSTSTDLNAPETRSVHTAVWTGNEMIVWGGALNNLNNRFDNGGRYDPQTDIWHDMSQTDAPPARAIHSAVWTGSEMIVWGGFPYNTSSGGRYNPTSNSWTPTTTTNAPTGRSGHSAIWTDNEMIIWGGNFLAPGGRYDPTSDTWHSISDLGAPVVRTHHSTIWTGHEMIVWGGNVDFEYFDDGGRYNPTFDTWLPTMLTGAPEARSDHTAVWTGRDMLIFGGQPLLQNIGVYRLEPDLIFENNFEADALKKQL